MKLLAALELPGSPAQRVEVYSVPRTAYTIAYVTEKEYYKYEWDEQWKSSGGGPVNGVTDTASAISYLTNKLLK